MKKLLTILGSLGMVATAGVAAATVVSCGTKDSDKALTPDADGNVTKAFDIAAAKDEKGTFLKVADADFDAPVIKVDGKDALAAKVKATVKVEQKQDSAKKAIDGSYTLTVTVNTKDLSDKDAHKVSVQVKSKENDKNVASAFDQTLNIEVKAAATPAPQPGDNTPAVDANQTVEVKAADGSVDVTGKNLSSIAKGDVAIAAASDGAATTPATADAIDSVTPSQDGKKVTIKFKGLVKDNNGKYTLTVKGTAVTLTITISAE